MALHPQRRSIAVKGAPPSNRNVSVHMSCTLNAEKSRLRGHHPLVQAAQWHIAAPSSAEIQCRGGNSMPRTPLIGTLLHPHPPKNKVKGAAYYSTGHSVAHCCTLNALSDGLKDSLSEGVSVRGWTEPSAVARKRWVSSGRGERGHPRQRQREGPDGYEFCAAGRSRHWEGWSRQSRRNRAATTRIPAAAGGGPSPGRWRKQMAAEGQIPGSRIRDKREQGCI